MPSKSVIYWYYCRISTLYDPRHFEQSHIRIRIQSGQCNVVDPDLLNTDPDSDPDPSFQVNMDPDGVFF